MFLGTKFPDFSLNGKLKVILQQKPFVSYYSF